MKKFSEMSPAMKVITVIGGVVAFAVAYYLGYHGVQALMAK